MPFVKTNRKGKIRLYKNRYRSGTANPAEIAKRFKEMEESKSKDPSE